jgi:hypothetical protein
MTFTFFMKWSLCFQWNVLCIWMKWSLHFYERTYVFFFKKWPLWSYTFKWQLYRLITPCFRHVLLLIYIPCSKLSVMTMIYITANLNNL